MITPILMLKQRSDSHLIILLIIFFFNNVLVVKVGNWNEAGTLITISHDGEKGEVEHAYLWDVNPATSFDSVTGSSDCAGSRPG